MCNRDKSIIGGVVIFFAIIMLILIWNIPSRKTVDIVVTETPITNPLPPEKPPVIEEKVPVIVPAPAKPLIPKEEKPVAKPEPKRYDIPKVEIPKELILPKYFFEEKIVPIKKKRKKRKKHYHHHEDFICK